VTDLKLEVQEFDKGVAYTAITLPDGRLVVSDTLEPVAVLYASQAAFEEDGQHIAVFPTLTHALMATMSDSPSFALDADTLLDVAGLDGVMDNLRFTPTQREAVESLGVGEAFVYELGGEPHRIVRVN